MLKEIHRIMAISFRVYLQRTSKTLETWLDENDVTKIEDFVPRCSFVGLSPSAVDIASAAEVFRLRAIPPSPPPSAPIPDAVQAQPIINDEPPKQAPKQRKKKDVVEPS